LDESLEFHQQILDVLRQPLEDGSIAISWSAAEVHFSYSVILILAMNTHR
jgi:magnesium chelatase family protein